jgi:hypothetical protein
LFQNGSIYLFHIRELLKMVYLNVTHAPFFFFDPLPIKNPYNNLILNKSTLYNIYFFHKFHTFIHSELLNLFFRTNFDIKELFAKHSSTLRTFSILNYLRCEPDHLRADIEEMLNYYNCRMECKFQIHVHIHFPTPLFVSILKPYLHLYLTAFYSYIEIEMIRAESELLERLKNLSIFNPTFGQMKSDNQSFDSRHPPFRPTNGNFLQNHIAHRGVRL